MGSSSRQRGLGSMLLSLMELLEQKKTTQPQEHPQEQDPRDDLLGHRRTQTDRKIMRNQPSSLLSVICVCLATLLMFGAAIGMFVF
jgi:hypothetical protein